VAGAAAWDVTGILWVDRNRNAHREEIVKAIPEFQEFISTLREELKKVTANLTEAETKKQTEEAKKLKEVRASTRNVLAKALTAAARNGHPHILERLGDSQKLVNTLASILIDCTKVEDYNGELPKAILKLMSQFISLNDELLAKVKLDVIRKRFVKKGDTDVKEAFAKIISSTPEAKEREKRAKAEAIKLEKIKNGLALQEKLKARKVEDSKANGSTAKRSHDGDNSNDKPAKKVASDATAINTAPKITGTSTKPITTRPTTGFFASLNRPASKPQTATARAPATTTAPVKKPEPKPVPVQTKQSSLADILASIEKPKELPKAPEAPRRAPETPEEKSKRERKESRRHLRVRWKEGSDLEQIRLFKHEQAEDEGRQENMLRDAHDDRSEGMRLKQAMEAPDAMDDEDEPAGEVLIRARYPELMGIDFSTLSEDSQRKNFVTRGGRVDFRTRQQDVQKRREDFELMTFYADPRDMPKSPKEPPSDNSGPPSQPKNFGKPNDVQLLQRIDEIWKYGRDQARSSWNHRWEEKNLARIRDQARGFNPQQTSSSSQQQSSTTTKMEGPQLNVLGWLNLLVQAFPADSSRAPPLNPLRITEGHIPVASPDEPKMDTAEITRLESTAATLKGKPYPPTEPPDWLNQQAKLAWWSAFRGDKARERLAAESQAERELKEARALYEKQNQFQAVQHQAQPQPSQTQTPQLFAPQVQTPQFPGLSIPGLSMPGIPTGFNIPPPQIAMSNSVASAYDSSQLQAIIAAMTNGQNSGTPQMPLQPQQQQTWNAQWAGHSNGTSDQSYGTQAQPQRWDSSWPTPQNNENLRAGYDSKQDNNSARTWDSSQGGDGEAEQHGRKKSRVPGPGDYKYKKKPCRFFQEGKCAKGEACTYVHE
jgi:hypothetical protein